MIRKNRQYALAKKARSFATSPQTRHRPAAPVCPSGIARQVARVSSRIRVSHAALPHLLQAAQDGPRNVADMVNISSVAGRVARLGSAVYNLTKHGVGAFSEALRQEVTQRHVRVSLVEPGAVSTELSSHNRPEILAQVSHLVSTETS